MPQLPQSAIDLIKRFEGFSPTPYKCPAGFLTFGYGSLVKHYPGIEFPVSPPAAEECLIKDLRVAEAAVRRLVSAPLTDNQFGALCSFTYNLGSGVLQRSTLRQRLNRGDYESVPHELAKWVYAGGRRLKGLVDRRLAEARLFAEVAIPVFYATLR